MEAIIDSAEAALERLKALVHTSFLHHDNEMMVIHLLLGLVAVGAFFFIRFIQQKNTNYRRAKRRRQKRRRLLKRSDPAFRRAVYAGVGIAGAETSSRSSSSNDDDGDLEDRKSWEQLHQQVPESTEEECQRFLDGAEGKRKKAVKALRKYMVWRDKHSKIEKDIFSNEEKMEKDGERDDGIPGDIADHQEWKIASRVAQKACNEFSEDELPRCARTFCMKGNKECVDRSGYRILKLAPGKMDDRLVPLSVYSKALALYIDRKLSRDSTERITILVDVRGGEGWRNLHVRKLVPFIKELLSNLKTLFPERLALLLIYPIPSTLKMFWKMVEGVLNEDMRERVRLLSGKAKIDAPPPLDEMTEFIEDDLVKHIEEERLAAFEPPQQ